MPLAHQKGACADVQVQEVPTAKCRDAGNAASRITLLIVHQHGVVSRKKLCFVRRLVCVVH